jgi:hypothetical protein
LIGRFTGRDNAGEPLVELPDGRLSSARSTIHLGEIEVGRDVALMFDRGDPERPIVLGVIAPPVTEQIRVGDGRSLRIEADGERLTITADKEIVLRCGEASITLTRAGKVLVRGTYVLSRSSGVNRLKGGSVQIN